MFLLTEDIIVTTIRIFTAVFLCGIIGLEREIKGHHAGFRTHLLVGVGACLMVLLSNFGFEEFLNSHTADNVRMDPSRLASYVVSGIGFLGAGTILVHGSTIKGLTTAASIWVVAGIGLVIGAGMYYAAFLVTIITVASLLLLNRFESIFVHSSKTKQLNIVVENKKISLSDVVNLVENEKINVIKVIVEDYPDTNDGLSLINYSLLVKYSEKKMTTKIYDQLHQTNFIYKVYTTTI